MKKTLWSFDFTIITIGTIISAIGGVAMSFALSLVVFDETASTMLTGLFTACSFLPSVLIHLLAAPYVDTHNRKKIIVYLDYFSGLCYFAFFLFIQRYAFQYIAYMCFSLLVNSISAIYSLAYNSLYPDLIPKGFAQKGYSISSLIYPSITAIFTPIASILYTQFGIAYIVLGEGILLWIAASLEHCIRFQEKREQVQVFSFMQYKENILEGLQYIKKEKGIRSIYEYMAVTNGAAEGLNLMSMAHFQSSEILTTTMYAGLTTAEMLGRICGACFHYVVKIPNHLRYRIAVMVYGGYELLDMVLLFIAYPLMLVNRFIAGFLGINSLNIREASTQNYIPAAMRARVSAFFNVIVTMFLIGGKLVAGALGEWLSYPYIAAGFALLSFCSILMLVVRNKKYIAPIYNQELS